MALFCPSVSVIHVSVTVTQFEIYQEPETVAAKLIIEVTIHFNFITPVLFPTGTCQSVLRSYENTLVDCDLYFIRSSVP